MDKAEVNNKRATIVAFLFDGISLTGPPSHRRGNPVGTVTIDLPYGSAEPQAKQSRRNSHNRSPSRVHRAAGEAIPSTPDLSGGKFMDERKGN